MPDVEQRKQSIMFCWNALQSYKLGALLQPQGFFHWLQFFQTSITYYDAYQAHFWNFFGLFGTFGKLGMTKNLRTWIVILEGSYILQKPRLNFGIRCNLAVSWGTMHLGYHPRIFLPSRAQDVSSMAPGMKQTLFQHWHGFTFRMPKKIFWWQQRIFEAVSPPYIQSWKDLFGPWIFWSFSRRRW